METKWCAREHGAGRRAKGKESERESRPVVSNSLPPHGLYSPWNSPGQNTGVGSFSLLQGIFLTQESNWGLLNCRQILYQLSYQGSHLFLWARLNSFLHTMELPYLLGAPVSFPIKYKEREPPHMTVMVIPWESGREDPAHHKHFKSGTHGDDAGGDQEEEEATLRVLMILLRKQYLERGSWVKVPLSQLHPHSSCTKS